MKDISRFTFICFTAIVAAFFLLPSFVFSSIDSEELVYEYNFPAGIYQVLKYSSSEEFDYNILHESDIPYSKYYYNASTDGLLEFTIEPINGSSPYIELVCNQTWESVGYTYTLKVYEGDSIMLQLTPNMRIQHSNITRIGEGSYSIFDTWNWPHTSGKIYANITPAESIVYDFTWAPITPEEDQEITFYSLSNPYAYYSWTLDNKQILSNSSVLELQGLSPGEHNVVLNVVDEFENTFTVSKTLSVTPSIIVSKPQALGIFNLEFPESIKAGESLKITVYLDYILQKEKSVQLKVSDSSGQKKSLNTDTLMGTGSKKYDLFVQAPHEAGKKEFSIEYLVLEETWSEFYPTSIIEVDVVAPEESGVIIPSYPILAIFLGVLLCIKLFNSIIQSKTPKKIPSYPILAIFLGVLLCIILLNSFEANPSIAL